LLDEFVARELTRPDAAPIDQDDRRAAEMWKLGLVAFGMHNRGTKHLHEDDLAEDLRALPGPAGPPARARGRGVTRPLSASRRVIGRFFFVNTSEVEGGRSYEFLHATFGDYLIAHHTVEQLRAAYTSLRARTTAQPWDDDLLFALLSHKLLLSAGGRAVVFFGELAGDDAGVAEVLDHLISRALTRWGPGRFADYDPSGLSSVQRLGAYTANLVLLRVAVAGSEGVAIAALCPPDADPAEWWAMQVRLWQATLPKTDASAMAIHVRMNSRGTGIALLPLWLRHNPRLESLAGDVDGAVAHALLNGFSEPGWFLHLKPNSADPADAVEELATLIVLDVRGRRTTTEPMPADSPANGLFAPLLLVWLDRAAPDLEYDDVRAYCEWILAVLGPEAEDSSQMLTSLLARHPRLRRDVRRFEFVVEGRQPPRAFLTLQLAGLVSDDAPRVYGTVLPEVATSPEGQLVAALPPDLARRLIPELAISLARRLESSLGTPDGADRKEGPLPNAIALGRGPSLRSRNPEPDGEQ